MNEKKLYDCKILKIENGIKTSIINILDKDYVKKELFKPKDDSIKMLENEIKCLEKLKKTNIVPRIINYDINGGYIIMELINGWQINHYKYKNEIEKIEMMIKVITAVQEIHKNNIIHCDIKLGNIIVSTDMDIKIIDFGISAIDGNNILKGYYSEKYSSMEQLEKDKVDIHIDLYALGVVFYFLIFDEYPFEGNSKELIEKKKKGLYKKTNNPRYNQIFDKIFSINNKEKYTTLEEFKRDLKLLITMV